MSKLTFQLKIQFPENATEPERFFRTAASLIESYNNLDNIILSTVTNPTESRLILEDLKKGSVVASFMRVIEGTDDDKLTPNQIVDYVSEARKNVTKSISENTQSSSKEIIHNIEEKLVETATELGIDSNLINKIPPIVMAESINAIAKSTTELRPNENAKIISESRDSISEIELSNSIPKLDIKQLASDLTDKEIENHVKLILLIRKLDFLGKSQWAFKKGDETIYANITDESWLKSLHNREIALYSGDALEVSMYEKTAYDIAGNQLSITREITEVLRVIRADKK